MTDPRQTRGTARRVSGLLCLLALLLSTPGMRAAGLLLGGACCGGGHCPIAGHRHGMPEPQKATPDCAHGMGQAGSQLEACTISCCKSDEQPALHGQLFLPASALRFSPDAPLRAPAARTRPHPLLLPLDPANPPPEAPEAVR